MTLLRRPPSGSKRRATREFSWLQTGAGLHGFDAAATIGGDGPGTVPVALPPETLAETERRLVGVWAADCAERVLGLFEAAAPGDTRPREAIAGIRAFARGELRMWATRSLGGHAQAAAREVAGPSAAAARAAGQAAVTAHMGAHALGAAAYAAKAAGMAAPDRPETLAEEIS